MDHLLKLRMTSTTPCGAHHVCIPWPQAALALCKTPAYDAASVPVYAVLALLMQVQFQHLKCLDVAMLLQALLLQAWSHITALFCILSNSGCLMDICC